MSTLKAYTKKVPIAAQAEIGTFRALRLFERFLALSTPVTANPFPATMTVDPTAGLPDQAGLWPFDVMAGDPEIGPAAPLVMTGRPDKRFPRSRRRENDFAARRRGRRRRIDRWRRVIHAGLS
jgi:hypothetical protein